MPRLKPVKFNDGTTTTHKVVERTSAYPDTDAGNAALLSAIGSGSIPLLDAPTSDRIVGVYNYDYAKSGSDYLGNPFVSAPSPTLQNSTRTKPRIRGNSFLHSPQTAINAFLSERLPAFSVHADWLVVYAGPGFQQTADRTPILLHGYSAMAENVPNRGQYSRSRLALLVPGGYDQANAKADEIALSDPMDARIAWLRGWKGTGSTHYLIDNQAAAQAFAQRVFADYQNSDWVDHANSGANLLAITPNFEVYTASPSSGNPAEVQWRNMDGYFMQGIKAAAIAASQPVPALIAYDWATMCHFSIALKSRNQQVSGVYTDLEPSVTYTPDVGVPFYFSYASIGDNFRGGSLSTPLASGNPYSQYLKDNGGYAGSAEYMRNTWDDQTLWQKNTTDGSFKTRIVSGVTLRVPRNDARRTVICGETTDILGAGYYSIGEGDNFLYLTYERLQQAIVDTFLRAGGIHLPLSTDRQSGWEQLKLVQWARYEAEFKSLNEVTKPDNSGIAINPATGTTYNVDLLNHRPLNPDFIERDVLGHLLLGRECYRFFMEPQPELAFQGASNANSHTRAPHEITQKALYRLSQFNWIRDNAFRYLIPQYLIRNIARDRSWYDPNEEFEKKPILFGGLCDSRADKASKPYFWFFASYPAQDISEQTQGIYWWVDGGGAAITPGYAYMMDGRQTFLDDHQVPDNVAGLSPTRFRTQFTDLMGEKHTLTGDYRSAKITSHPTPPALAS